MPAPRNTLFALAAISGIPGIAIAAIGGLALGAVLLAPTAAQAAASNWAVNEQSRVRLITAYQVAPRNGDLRLGLHFTLSPGWHVYWKNSGDAGFPPQLTFEKTQGLSGTELLWPAPHRFELPGDLVAFGYEDEVVYPVRATLKSTQDALEIVADIDYLVCEVDCVPYRYPLKLTQRLGDAPVPDPETVPLLEAAWASLPTAVERLEGAATQGFLEQVGSGSPVLEVRVSGVDGDPAGVDLFLESHEAFDTGKPQVRKEADGLAFRVPLQPHTAGQALPAKTPFAWTVTGLRHDGRPVSLEARREVELQSAVAAAAGEPQAAASGGLAKMLAFAFLGGALLNLTPTVLALLVPALLDLRRSPSGSKALAAVAGILAACWGFAALAAAAQSTGMPAVWGAQLQEPAVAALLAVASALLAFNLWGLLPFPLAPVAPASGPAGPGRLFLAGLLTPALALAWVVAPLSLPFGFAVERGPGATLAMLTALGLGLSVPYLALAAAPTRARAFPEPGPWLDRLREALGFVAAAGAFWLLYALSHQVSAEGLAWIELALLAMALFSWLGHKALRSPLKFALALCLLACAVLALWLADRNRLSPRLPSPDAMAFTSSPSPPAAATGGRDLS